MTAADSRDSDLLAPSDTFTARHIGPSDGDVAEMLARIGCASLAERQNRELQGLLAFRRRQPVRLVPARIVDRNFATLPTTAVLDVGRADGVEVNLPVVTDRGLIGKTVAAGRRLTRVMLYSHPDFSASALLVGGDHLEYGIAAPAAVACSSSTSRCGPNRPPATGS